MKKKTIIGLYTLTMMGILIILTNSCKKKIDDSTTIQQSIPITTKIIDSVNWVNNIVSIDTANYIFTFNNALLNNVALKPGDILVSTIGEGYLRKVVSIAQSGNNIIIQTSFARLSEAVNNGSFSFTYVLSAQKMRKPKYIRSGVTIDTSGMKSNTNSNLVYNIDTYIDNDQLIHLTGQFSLLPTIHCSSFWELLNNNYFHIDYQVQEQVNLNASINFLNLQYSHEVELLNIPFEPIIVWIGQLPVVLIPSIEIVAGAQLNVQSSITTSANQQLTYTLGITYENNQWTPVNTLDTSFTFSPPSLSASASAKVYIKPKFIISVYGVISPYLYGECYSRIQADIFNTPWWSLYAGANAGLGVHMEVWGLIPDYTPPPFFEYETLLAQAVEQLPTVSTNSVSNITQTSATCGGNATSQGSSPISARGVCWSTSTHPTTSSFHTTDGTGAGSFTSNITGLTPNTLYYVRAYATNSTGTAYGNEVTFTTLNSTFTCGDVVSYEGKNYNTIQIATQCWIKENLNVGTRIDASQNQNGSNGIKEKYCYNNLDSNCNIYGGLYQWDEVMQGSATPGAEGICPASWHIPTHEEWNVLIAFLGGNIIAGGKMKEAGYDHWAYPNTGATNSCGSTVLPGGMGGGNGSFGGITNFAYIWSSSQFDLNSAWSVQLNFTTEGLGLSNDASNSFGFSVRCIKN